MQVDVLEVLADAEAAVYDAGDLSLGSEITQAMNAVADLLAATAALLSCRHGNYPMEGWIPDNDTTRAQIDALAFALARVQP